MRKADRRAMGAAEGRVENKKRKRKLEGSTPPNIQTRGVGDKVKMYDNPQAVCGRELCTTWRHMARPGYKEQQHRQRYLKHSVQSRCSPCSFLLFLVFCWPWPCYVELRVTSKIVASLKSQQHECGCDLDWAARLFTKAYTIALFTRAGKQRISLTWYHFPNPKNL